jgi:hypothetical protein
VVLIVVPPSNFVSAAAMHTVLPRWVKSGGSGVAGPPSGLPSIPDIVLRPAGGPKLVLDRGDRMLQLPRNKQRSARKQNPRRPLRRGRDAQDRGGGPKEKAPPGAFWGQQNYFVVLSLLSGFVSHFL